MTAVALSAALVVGAHLSAAPAAGQTCPGGLPERGDVGIRALRCTGPAASCAINVRSGAGAVIRHTFAVEPVVTAITSEARDLRPGDTIVAIEGVLITTAARGERLAQLPVGRTIVLLIRRDGALVDLQLTTRSGCGVTSLEVVR